MLGSLGRYIELRKKVYICGLLNGREITIPSGADQADLFVGLSINLHVTGHLRVFLLITSLSSVVRFSKKTWPTPGSLVLRSHVFSSDRSRLRFCTHRS